MIAHQINRFKGCTAFLVTDERPPEELAKLNRRGILIVAAENANIRPHIWFGDDRYNNDPNIIKFAGEVQSDLLKEIGIGRLYHVGQCDLDDAVAYALRYMPTYDNVAGLYS